MGEEHAVEMLKAGAHEYVLKENLARLVLAVNRELRAARPRNRNQSGPTLDLGLWTPVAVSPSIIFRRSKSATLTRCHFES